MGAQELAQRVDAITQAAQNEAQALADAGRLREVKVRGVKRDLNDLPQRLIRPKSRLPGPARRGASRRVPGLPSPVRRISSSVCALA